MIKAGDIVTVDFAGATGVKRRPMVVLSSDTYHAERPDLIVGLITTNVAAATAQSDCVLQDWQAAGLHKPSAFRAYVGMVRINAAKKVGRLTDRDWTAVRERLQRALG